VPDLSTADGKLKRAGLSEQLAGHLTDLIVDGAVAPYQALPTERELAKRFSVSMSVVREAIKGLAAIGLVEVRHGVGTFVKPRDQWNTSAPMMLLVQSEPGSVLDVLDVREPLEMLSVTEAARRGTDDDLQLVDSALEAMREGIDQPDAFVRADLAFHLALAKATHNRILMSVLQPLIEPIHECMLRGYQIQGAAERGLAEHEEIAADVRAHSVQQAQASMRRHMETNRAELIRLIDQPAENGAEG
jgi:GntR family transcriptional repressor for pyruvate dehydrogenase complex